MSPASATVVRARQSDVALAQQAMLVSHRTRALDETALRNFINNPASYLLMALDGEEVVGSLYGYALNHPHRPEPQFFLYGIDVCPERWNRGIGTALVNEFVAQARSAGAFEVWVLTNESNSAAISMYTHAGLLRRNTDDVMLELPLSRP